MDQFITLYDVTGIQDFIFSRQKLKENIGASLLVQKVLEDDLSEAIKATCSTYQTNWKKATTFAFLQKQLDAEIIYIGGGNAMVAYSNKEVYQKVSKRLARTVLEKSRGQLKVVSEAVGIDFANFSKVRKLLFQKIREVKLKTSPTCLLTGFSINQANLIDQLPATENENGEYLNKIVQSIRKMGDHAHYEKRLGFDENIQFPKDFDHLVPRDTKKYMAVVHIDGNNMGKQIESYISHCTSYDEFVQAIRSLSIAINNHYKNVMKDTILFLKDKLKEKPKICKKLNCKAELPLRIVILNGDDITFVTHGLLGITLTEYFLKKIQEQPLQLPGDRTMAVSACGGVAIVKSHFPFFRAYQLAEELCSSAKRKGKVLGRLHGKDEENPGCWFDVQVIQSGMSTDLEDIRKRQYVLADVEPLNESGGEETGGMTFPRYHLLWRPWIVGKAFNDQRIYQFDEFKKVYRYFLHDTKNKWPRSRLKDLQQAYLTSYAEVIHVLQKARSRGYQLPPMDGEENGFVQNQSPYFDCLELMDYYIEL
ncbi:MAG: Cas10/Cmr2 second palm domain-containing protein [Candidatus Helarchaeota archaeon]